MKTLLRTESVIVGIMGLAFVVLSLFTTSLLFVSSDLGPPNALVPRATGAILLLFAFTCWGWGNRERSQMNYFVGIMLFFDIAMAAL